MRATTTAVVVALICGCGDDGGRADSGPIATDGATGSTATASSGETEPVTPTTGTPGTASQTGSTTGDETSTGVVTSSSDSESSTGAGACEDCSEANQVCQDGVCVTLCFGQVPTPCAADQVCDVVSGECKPEDAACVLTGPQVDCGGRSCGPGSVCDDQGSCVPVAPCLDVACTSEGACWGTLCGCERPIACADPPLEALNGPFSDKIIGIDFADDCTAWMVTLRDGVDYLRRLLPDGTLTEWAGVSNLDMGEVKVLRSLTLPQLTVPLPLAGAPVGPVQPVPVEGLGEVAITYTCIGGCDGPDPQGVARLVEDDPVNPLPLVIIAAVTTGAGPFGVPVVDAGPQGLTWGVDRVLYVGNSTANGEFNRADLEGGTQEVVTTFSERVHASAPVSPVHLLVALEGGALRRYNVITQISTPVADLAAHVTALSHDPFNNKVYASLSTLEVVIVDAFTGEIEDFATMPDKGRVAVSPSGKLYFMPADYFAPGDILAWDLPATL